MNIIELIYSGNMSIYINNSIKFHRNIQIKKLQPKIYSKYIKKTKLHLFQIRTLFNKFKNTDIKELLITNSILVLLYYSIDFNINFRLGSLIRTIHYFIIYIFIIYLHLIWPQESCFLLFIVEAIYHNYKFVFLFIRKPQLPLQLKLH